MVLSVGADNPLPSTLRSNHKSRMCVCVFMYSPSNITIQKKRKESHSLAFMDVMCGLKKSSLRPQKKAG